MSTAPELIDFLDTHIAAWVLPCPLLRDNQTSQGVKNESEWMRLTVIEGFSSIRSVTSLLDIRGSTAAHPFILRFDIYTPINKGTRRAAEIFQSISDHWAYQQHGSIHFDAASSERVGEEASLYHTAATIEAARYEALGIN